MILFVEDDPTTRALVQQTLQQGGYMCHTASSGSEALEAIDKQSPDLILLDLNLPDTNGLELFDQIRSKSGHANTPIVFLSSSAEDSDINAGLSRGAEDYLLKPVVPALLLGKLEATFARQASRVPALSARMSACPEDVVDAARNPDNLVDKYVLVHEIGRGGMGVVLKAWDTTLDTWVALKFLRPEMDRTSTERLFREAQTVVRLHHKNICRIFDLRRTNDKQYFIAMQYIDGKNCDDCFEPRDAASIVAQIADALNYAHDLGVFHRDIKPENLLVDEDGRAWIMDFGISTTVATFKRLTPSGLVLGSPRYMSPQYLRTGRADVLSEVYSLGATLYHMLIGDPPYEEHPTREVFKKVAQGELDPPTKFNPEIPSDLEQIVLRAMDKDIDRRYQNAGELAADLRAFLDGKPISVLPSEGWLRRLF